ncbi:DUF6341 family protein [Ulvibacter litoralis]|uniref:Uracil phosphoribosyltransferase n=1 Tax=Ulvibacter litoralis TaxID=227084 RepID=A0A1G7D7G1_9FLAO|nr:uracil phosphoribosyltransferase [Ulvibacter litoralis]GHC44583.1 hypothetical protein GCM10008083_03940 [Ulvibacter litoralis]SDE47502.1 hypothetical protein SAMN05421855_101812 [Ulvibacter litoralis]
MSWKAVFESVQSLTEDVLLTPYNALRTMELDNWWMANFVSWILMAIGFVAFIYWMGELKKYDDNDEEDKTSTSHSFLGK